MAEVELLDRGYAAVMRRVVESGQAQHYTELAAELGIELAAARDLVHELVALTPGWVHPGTDHLASFPPFNIQPTQYRVTIDGEQRWFAQCGFEALAVRWLVPGPAFRVAHRGPHQEPVELRLGKRIGAVHVDRVLRCDDHEGTRHVPCDTVDGDVAFFHHLEQRGLRAR